MKSQATRSFELRLFFSTLSSLLLQKRNILLITRVYCPTVLLCRNFPLESMQSIQLYIYIHIKHSAILVNYMKSHFISVACLRDESFVLHSFQWERDYLVNSRAKACRDNHFPPQIYRENSTWWQILRVVMCRINHILQRCVWSYCCCCETLSFLNFQRVIDFCCSIGWYPTNSCSYGILSVVCNLIPHIKHFKYLHIIVDLLSKLIIFFFLSFYRKCYTQSVTRVDRYNGSSSLRKMAFKPWLNILFYTMSHILSMCILLSRRYTIQRVYNL